MQLSFLGKSYTASTPSIETMESQQTCLYWVASLLLSNTALFTVSRVIVTGWKPPLKPNLSTG